MSALPFPLMAGIEKYLKGAKRIFDVGTGPDGAYWWPLVDQNSSIEGIEYYDFPKRVPKYVKVYKMDASNLANIKRVMTLEQIAPSLPIFKRKQVSWLGQFDLVVANHVLEHVPDFPAAVAGIAKLLKPGGKVFAGFPDHRNFTDIMYHLLLPDGGGHIQLLTDRIVIKEFKKHGLMCISQRTWPDDWLWFQKRYNWQSYAWPKNKYLSQDKIDYLANVFRKELTPQKGYFYGWEMVFQKNNPTL